MCVWNDCNNDLCLLNSSAPHCILTFFLIRTDGFYSYSGYNPALGFSLSICTNVETPVFKANLYDICNRINAELLQQLAR
jgi:hypothetical protein